MVKIIYAIQSDGLGHYSRSKVMIDHFIELGFKVKILTADRPYALLKQDGYDVEEVIRVPFTYRNNSVDYVSTAYNFMKDFTKLVKDGYLRVRKIVREFNPDILISDGEMFSGRVAIDEKVPLVAIDNIHSITHTTAGDEVTGWKTGKPQQKLLINILSPRDLKIEHMFILSFFDTDVKRDDKVTLVKPLIRKEVLDIQPTKQDYVLVYQTSQTNKRLFPALTDIPQENFIVYGFDKEGKRANMEFKKTTTTNFISDLAGCKAVITNGGFSLMSEAIFLKKPILSNPVEGQYEQILNATFLERLGYGKFIKKIDADSIRAFLYNLDVYRKNLESYAQKDNIEAFRVIDTKIHEILAKKNK